MVNHRIPDHYTKIIMCFDTDEEIIKQRVETRGEKTGKIISEHILKSMAKSYNIPTVEENTISNIWVESHKRNWQPKYAGTLYD